MSKMILITQTPPGQAPEDVRKAWVGLKIPLSPDQSEGFSAGVLGGKAEPANLNGYSVGAKEAVQALLDAKKCEAADWWQTHGYGFGNERLMFGKAFCQVIEA